jgi:hypothetical protein
MSPPTHIFASFGSRALSMLTSQRMHLKTLCFRQMKYLRASARKESLNNVPTPREAIGFRRAHPEVRLQLCGDDISCRCLWSNNHVEVESIISNMSRRPKRFGLHQTTQPEHCLRTSVTKDGKESMDGQSSSNTAHAVAC